MFYHSNSNSETAVDYSSTNPSHTSSSASGNEPIPYETMTPFQRLRVLVHKLDITEDTLHAINSLLDHLGRQLENSYHEVLWPGDDDDDSTVVQEDDGRDTDYEGVDESLWRGLSIERNERIRELREELGEVKEELEALKSVVVR